MRVNCGAGRLLLLRRRRWCAEGAVDWARFCTESAEAAAEASRLDEELRGVRSRPFPASLDARLRKVVQRTQPPPDEAAAQAALLKVVRREVRELQPPDGIEASSMDVLHFGSTAMGMAFPGGDLDISLTWPGHGDEELAEGEAARLLTELAARMAGGFTDVDVAVGARIPVLSARHRDTGVACDIVVTSSGADLKSPCMGQVIAADARLSFLSRLIKVWARRHGFNNPKKHTFNSWCLSLLCLFHLQCAPAVGPRIPPLLQFMPDGGSDSSRQSYQHRRGVLASFGSLAPQLCAGSSAGWSEAALLHGFFQQLHRIGPLMRSGICAAPLEGTWRGTADDEETTQLRRGTCRVVDPFQFGDNCARTVDARRVKFFWMQCGEMAEAMQRARDSRLSEAALMDMLFGDVGAVLAGAAQPEVKPEGQPCDQLIVRLSSQATREQEVATLLGEGRPGSGLVELGGFRAGESKPGGNRSGRIFARYETQRHAERVYGLLARLNTQSLTVAPFDGRLGLQLLPNSECVLSVKDDSPAALAGFEPGMRIQRVDGDRAGSASAVRQLLQDAIERQRDSGASFTVAVTAGTVPRGLRLVIGVEWPFEPMLGHERGVLSRPTHSGRKLPLSEALQEHAVSELVGRTMNAPHSSAIYAFEGLDEGTVSTNTFTRRSKQGDTEVSIHEYFTGTLGMRLSQHSAVARARTLKGRHADSVIQLPAEVALVWL